MNRNPFAANVVPRVSIVRLASSSSGSKTIPVLDEHLVELACGARRPPRGRMLLHLVFMSQRMKYLGFRFL
jgi:hypothetical protein